MKKIILITFLFLIRLFQANGQWCPIEYNIITNFESNSDTIVIDTSINDNIWQIGKPQKIFFDSAYSGNKVIVTDTINPYPISNYSTFIIRIDTNQFFLNQERTFLTFIHKFDTDSLMDGGYIEVSYDNSNWINVINDTMPDDFLCPMNFYSDTIANGEKAFSGKSNGWITSSIQWVWHMGVKMHDPPDSMFLRFVFSSDSIQSNKDGWMIDDISIGYISYGGVEENESKNDISIYPNPTTGKINLQVSQHFGKIKTLEIYDCIGQLQIKVTDNFSELDISSFKSGLYFIVLTNDKEEKLVSKVLKE